MTDIPQGAVKLTRADAVKMVATNIAELAAHDVAACEGHAIFCCSQFRKYVIELACDKYDTPLTAIGIPFHHNIAGMHKTTPYRVYEDGSDSGTTAQVVFADHQQTYEARFRIALTVELDAAALGLRLRWLGALQALRDARKRDLRMGAMKKEARDLLIKAALADTPEGEAVVASIRALAAALKAKV